MATNYEQEWQDFLVKIYDWAKDEPKSWTHLTLLSYFLVKYKTVNGLEFIFASCKKGPTQSKEIKDAIRIWNMFDRSRYKALTNKEEKLAYKEQLVGILKEYMDWAFDIKFRGKEVNVTGLGIFAVAGFMNEFLQWRKARMTALPRRNDPLPKEFLEWARNNASVGCPFGDIFKRQQLAVLEDLNALLNYVETYDEQYNNPDHDGLLSIEAIVLKKAREMGIMPKQGRLELNKK